MECVLNWPTCKRTIMQGKGPYEKEGCPMQEKPRCLLKPKLCPLLPDDEACTLTKLMEAQKAGGCFANYNPPSSNFCPCCPQNQKPAESFVDPNLPQCRLNKVVQMPPCRRCGAGMDFFKKPTETPTQAKFPPEEKKSKSKPDKPTKSKKHLKNTVDRELSKLKIRDKTVPDCTLSSRRPFPCSECISELLDSTMNEYDSSKVYCKKRSIKCPFTQVVDICDPDCPCSNVAPINTGPPCPFLPKPCPCCTAPRCPLTRIPPCPLVERIRPPGCKPLKCRCFCPTIPNPCSITYPQCLMHSGQVKCPLGTCGGPSACPALTPPICLCPGPDNQRKDDFLVEIKKEISGPNIGKVDLKVKVQEQPIAKLDTPSHQMAKIVPKTEDKPKTKGYDKKMLFQDEAQSHHPHFALTKTPLLGDVPGSNNYTSCRGSMVSHNMLRSKNSKGNGHNFFSKQFKLSTNNSALKSSQIPSLYKLTSENHQLEKSSQERKGMYIEQHYPNSYTERLYKSKRATKLKKGNDLKYQCLLKKNNFKCVESMENEEHNSNDNVFLFSKLQMAKALPPATISTLQIIIPKKVEAPKFCKSESMDIESLEDVVNENLRCLCGVSSATKNYFGKSDIGPTLSTQTFVDRIKGKIERPEFNFVKDFDTSDDEKLTQMLPKKRKKEICPCEKTKLTNNCPCSYCSCGQECPYYESPCDCGEDCPSKTKKMEIEQKYHVPTCPRSSPLEQPKSPKENDKICPFAPNPCPIGPYCPFPVDSIYDPNSPPIPEPDLRCPCGPPEKPFCPMSSNPCPLQPCPPCPLDPIKPLSIKKPLICPYAPLPPCPLNSCIPCPMMPQNSTQCPIIQPCMPCCPLAPPPPPIFQNCPLVSCQCNNQQSVVPLASCKCHNQEKAAPISPLASCKCNNQQSDIPNLLLTSCQCNNLQNLNFQQKSSNETQQLSIPTATTKQTQLNIQSQLPMPVTTLGAASYKGKNLSPPSRMPNYSNPPPCNCCNSQKACPCSDFHDVKIVCALGVENCPCEKLNEVNICPMNTLQCPLSSPICPIPPKIELAEIAQDKFVGKTEEKQKLKAEVKSTSKIVNELNEKKTIEPNMFPKLPDDDLDSEESSSSLNETKQIGFKNTNDSSQSMQTSLGRQSLKSNSKSISSRKSIKLSVSSKKDKGSKARSVVTPQPLFELKTKKKKFILKPPAGPKCVLEPPECPLAGATRPVFAEGIGQLPVAEKARQMKTIPKTQCPANTGCLIDNLITMGKEPLDCPVKQEPCELFPQGRCPMGDLGVCNCNFPVAPCMVPPQCGDYVAPLQYCYKEDCCMGLPLPPTYPAEHGKYEGIYYKFKDWKPGKITTKHYVDMQNEPPEITFFKGHPKREFDNWWIIRAGEGYTQCKKVKEIIDKRGPVGERGTVFDPKDNPMDYETKVVIENRLMRERQKLKAEKLDFLS